MALALVLLVACQRENTERQRPAADCSAVAETLASVELGNYAPALQRTPSVARHRAECETAHVTTAEAACLAKATDTWSAAACVPRMFPKQAATDNGDCEEVVKHVKLSVQHEITQVGADAERMIARLLPVMRQACQEDAWPAAVKACIMAVKAGDAPAMQKCSSAMPKELQDKLQRRLLAMSPAGP